MANTRTGRTSTVVAITGAAGYVGSRVIQELCSDARVERVLGFDVRPPEFRHPKFVFDEIDVRNATLRSRLKGVDVVVHLAFIMDPIKDEALMRDVNLNGSHNVFRSAAEAGVRKIVYTSSATVYGAHPDNDFPLTEESPLRANLDFSYPAHKLEVEYVVKEVREEFPDLQFVVFRPAIVFGPHANNAWSHQLESPVIFGIKGYAPPLQFVHEDDVARAITFGIFEDVDGPYNLAAEGWLERDQILDVVGRPTLQLSEARAFSMADRMWSSGLAEAPPGMLHYVMHPWVVSVDKLTAAGFTCTKTNHEALRDTAEQTNGYVRLGRNRLAKSRVAAGCAAGAGVVGTLALVRSARSRARGG
ncbi:MAG: NAD-dependent epimerase/dehydratase family protein [Actinomycetota bacterium]|nr:NAD-dependent epimerase/dehydratase family protein [Actinomycetota bacterium]